MKCMGCGIEKDLNVFETFPFAGQRITQKIPIEPLFVLECQPNNDDEWRMAITCHECFTKLSPDMWISEDCWIRINPVIPFNELPIDNLPIETDEECRIRWNAKSYDQQ